MIGTLLLLQGGMTAGLVVAGSILVGALTLAGNALRNAT